MAKRKDLLLTESVTARMMGLAGIGSLANPFLKEERNPPENVDHGPQGDQEEDEEDMEEGLDLEEGWHEEEMNERELHGDYDMDLGDEDHMGDHEHECPECGAEMDHGRCEECGHREEDEEEDMEDEEEDEEDMEDDEEDMEDDEEDFEDDEEDEMEELEEAKCASCGKKMCECGSKGYMQESVRKSMKRLKALLEQAEKDEEAPDMPPAEEAPAELAPEMAPAGGDEMEAKIKDFVKKLGDLVQETLGVEVTVEEGSEEPEAPKGEEELPPPPEAAGAPAPMAEAIDRLVNKVAARVKARLMEAKKGAEDKKLSKDRGDARKHKEAMKMKALKEKQVAAKKAEMEKKKKAGLKKEAKGKMEIKGSKYLGKNLRAKKDEKKPEAKKPAKK